MPEKLSSLERVTGKPKWPYSAKKPLKSFKEDFRMHKGRKLFEYEVPKTPEQLKIIKLVNEETNKLRRKFGFKDFNIPPENIYILKEGFWPLEEEKTTGFFSSLDQYIATKDFGDDALRFAHHIFHEILHCKSFGSLKFNKETFNYEPDRIGLQAITRTKEEYFNWLNEAVVEKLSILFIRKEIQQDQKLFKQNKELLKKSGADLTNIDSRAYRIERLILDILIEKILEKHEEFESEEDVLDEFTKSLFSSNLLAVGRLIDRTFGKGTFRKLGELGERKDRKDLLDFVKNL